MNASTDRHRSRRQLLRLALATSASAGATRLVAGSSAEAKTGDAVIIDSPGNQGEGVTSLRSTTPSSVLAITNDNADQGNGIIAAGKGDGWGVWGNADSGPAIVGNAAQGVGVHAASVSGTALEAKSTSGLAIRATGGLAFSSAGTGAFQRGEVSRAVTGPATPPGCSILVTLNQNPGPGNALKYVKRTGPAGFTVYLLKPVAGRVGFSYFVIANAPNA